MNINESSVQVLNDLKSVLERISKALYNHKHPLLYHASIGQHSRHIIEFFQCLEEQYQSAKVCYDLRKRALSFEEKSDEAVSAIERCIDWLLSNPKDMAVDLLVSHDIDFVFSHNKIASSLSRELAFNIEHAIHHMAIIKISIKLQDPDFEMPEHFGVAPSTLRYLRQQTATEASN